MMRAIVSLCVRHFGAVTALTVVALVLGCWGALQRRSMSFPSSCLRRSTSRPKLPASLPSRWRNSSPSRWKMRSTVRPGSRRCAPSRFRGCRWSPSRSRTASTCMSRARGSPSDYRSSAALCRRAWARRNSRRWSRAPWICSRSACCRTRSMPITLRDTADWIIKPRLLAVPGVAHVIVFGGDVPADTNPAGHAASWRASASRSAMIADAARAALPLRGAGFIDTRRRSGCCSSHRRRSPMSLRSARRSSRCATARRSCCATSPR